MARFVLPTANASYIPIFWDINMQPLLQTKGWWSEKIPNYCDRIIFSRHKFSVCQTPELLGLFPLSTTQRSGCLRPLWPHCSCPDWPEYSHGFEQSWVITWFWTILSIHMILNNLGSTWCSPRWRFCAGTRKAQLPSVEDGHQSTGIADLLTFFGLLIKLFSFKVTQSPGFWG